MPDYGLSVVWIEPIPDIFEKLQFNLNGIPKQIAIKGLVTDRDIWNILFILLIITEHLHRFWI